MSATVNIDAILARHTVEGDDKATIANLSAALAESESFAYGRMESFFTGEEGRTRRRLEAFEKCAQRWCTAQAMTRHLIDRIRREPNRWDDEAVRHRIAEIAAHAGPAPTTVAAQKH